MVYHRPVCNLFCQNSFIIMNKAALIFVMLCILFIGCGKAYKSDLAAEPSSTQQQKLKCEAFLFDARITRDNKYNSFRLELYQTDSLIGISGRGYLGKGALKGWVSRDSLLVYFPTTQEFVRDANNDVWKSFKCIGDEKQLNIFDLITRLPEDVVSKDMFQLVLVKDEEKEKEYRISKADCDWLISAEYDLHDKGWRLKEFHISEGEKFELRGKRREYRDAVEIKTERFTPRIGSDAIRVIL